MSDTTINELKEESHQILQNWLQSCTRHGRLSRNTIAVGIVVLHHLRNKCPVTPDEVTSPGGEIRDARSGLHEIMRIYGISQPEKYLKEVTTRQAHPDGIRLFESFEYGGFFANFSKEEQERLLLELINTLIGKVNEWFRRQNLKISFERNYSPVEWIHKILEEAKGKSGGVVEQHLVGAKLERRHTDVEVLNFPGYAADVQTGRYGDFTIGDTVYHVTATPGPSVIKKCSENIKSGLHPVLLVPKVHIGKSLSFAEYEGIEKCLSVIAIEDFVALNIIEMATGARARFIDILQEIINIYNERLEEVETDMSLKIEIQ
jgi:hypothetical protein